MTQQSHCWAYTPKKRKRKGKLLSHVELCKPMDCSLPNSSVHGIFQARTLEWVAISYSRGSPHPGIKPRPPALPGQFTTESPGKPMLSCLSCHKLCLVPLILLKFNLIFSLIIYPLSLFKVAKLPAFT